MHIQTSSLWGTMMCDVWMIDSDAMSLFTHSSGLSIPKMNLQKVGELSSWFSYGQVINTSTNKQLKDTTSSGATTTLAPLLTQRVRRLPSLCIPLVLYFILFCLRPAATTSARETVLSGIALLLLLLPPPPPAAPSLRALLLLPPSSPALASPMPCTCM